uniref:DIOX_N domain-containing protein n=1 Tax=Strongyloides venezuelensis TaxID=75913 RepID=A0A0K0FTE5_STRVS
MMTTDKDLPMNETSSDILKGPVKVRCFDTDLSNGDADKKFQEIKNDTMFVDVTNYLKKEFELKDYGFVDSN